MLSPDNEYFTVLIKINNIFFQISDFSNTANGNKWMMEMHGCPQPGSLLPSTLQFEQKISQMWPMYSLLRLKVRDTRARMF